jgi:hypothetical protein
MMWGSQCVFQEVLQGDTCLCTLLPDACSANCLAISNAASAQHQAHAGGLMLTMMAMVTGTEMKMILLPRHTRGWNVDVFKKRQVMK